MRLLTALAVATASISTMAGAQTERDLDAHEHGSASLNVALDGADIILELETPWNNLVGFEHEPNTAEQKELIDDAMSLLNNPKALFTFEGTDCTEVDSLVESGLAASEGSDHEHDEHDEHDDDEASAHSSVFVSYTFTCVDITQLKTIDVELLDIWSGFEDLDVQLIGPGGQALVELGQQQSVIDITQVQ